MTFPNIIFIFLSGTKKVNVFQVKLKYIYNEIQLLQLIKLKLKCPSKKFEADKTSLRKSYERL